MSEYFYHKGSLKFKKGSAKEAYKEIVATEYGKTAEEYDKIKVSKDSIEIDTINMGSFPLTSLTEFHDKLTTLLSELSSKCTLEHYCYNEGYYKLTLDPDNKKILFKKTQSKDPHENDPVIEPGEATSILYSQDDLLEELQEILPDVDSEKVLDTYYKIVRKYLKSGDSISTPLGILVKSESLLDGEGDITTFQWSDEL